jgi:hypothetical protein
VFDAEVLPLDEVPKFSVHHLAVQDFFDYPFFLAIDDFGEWRGNYTSASDRVIRSRCQFDNVEHRMNATHGRG